MFDNEFEEYVKSTGITDPYTISAMQGTWDCLLAVVVDAYKQSRSLKQDE